MPWFIKNLSEINTSKIYSTDSQCPKKKQKTKEYTILFIETLIAYHHCAPIHLTGGPKINPAI